MLQVSQFAEYFQAIHQVMPFPWQQRLLEQVASTGVWPQTLDLPTGAGKTSILDVSLFALACGVKVPRRTVLVVDRRIVVDDAYRRAEKIRKALNPSDAVAQIPVLVQMREALLKLGGSSPVEIALLRGGIYREDNWVRDPLQPLLVCSTVDQVGSRLLFQGYGVSSFARPIHAAMLANDCLIILDEAHTSEPFRQTLEWIAKYRAFAKNPLNLPFAVVTMTATPHSAESLFSINQDDRKNVTLKKRLEAKKILHKVTTAKPEIGGLVSQIIQEVPSYTGLGKTILVVVNQVKTAREVADQLKDKITAKKDPWKIESPILLTGRSRPVEREKLLAPHLDAQKNRLFSGRCREAFQEAKPLIVVATQCVEVGADLDVDVLISEVCPLDSLRQRLGRLDRLGKLEKTDVILVAPKEIEEEKWEDPIYGKTPQVVWNWLQDGWDLGITGMQEQLKNVNNENQQKMITKPLDAPVMFPAYLDLWVQTSPEPAVVPEPALFLHGPQRGTPEVQIVWRFDLEEEHTEQWAAIVSECPPVVGEALSVPLYQARQWLGNSKASEDGSDWENEMTLVETTQDKKKQEEKKFNPFLRWKGQDSSTLGTASTDLHPGDTIIVPCSRGGCDAWGWAPQSNEPVEDLADLARFKAHRAPVLRVHPQSPENVRTLFSSVLSEKEGEEESDQIEMQLREILKTLDPEKISDEALKASLDALKKTTETSGGLEFRPHPCGTGWVLRGKQRMSSSEIDDDDASSRLDRPVLLEEHCRDVSNVVNTFVQKLQLSDSIAESLKTAGWLHDLGKADLRFQAMLHQGNRFKVHSCGLLAKSAKAPASLTERESARIKSGYPQGARHELLSVRLAESGNWNAQNKDLLLHLIASHHGRCRPFAPIVEDVAPRSVSLDWDGQKLSASSDNVRDGMGIEHLASGVAERFWSLVRLYGWWGLAYLESCLRLADWKASAEESQGGKA